MIELGVNYIDALKAREIHNKRMKTLIDALKLADDSLKDKTAPHKIQLFNIRDLAWYEGDMDKANFITAKLREFPMSMDMSDAELLTRY